MNNSKIEVKWYYNETFPILPIVRIRKADKYNTWSISIKWLFFTLWTLDTFQFELSIVFDTHWGIGIIGIMPYLRWCICIPCPMKLGIKFNKLTSRYRIKND
jgi:hypothetical protein